jgi:hypothetical protein
MADRDTPVGDEIDLRPNGTVRLTLAGKSVTWRRPTFGEYRKFRESLVVAGDEEAALAKEIEATAREAAGTPEIPWPADRNPPYTPAQRLRLEMAGAEALGGWAIDVWRILCQREAPGLDDLPVWMVDASFSRSLFEHWRSVPLAVSSSK